MNMRRSIGFVAVGALSALAFSSCSDDEPVDMLARCEEARQRRVAEWESVWPADMLADDSTFHWESAQRPLTEVANQFSYDNGVIEATGSTDGNPWFCVYDPDERLTTVAKWGWDE
jgi:hypothetical protein